MKNAFIGGSTCFNPLRGNPVDLQHQGARGLRPRDGFQSPTGQSGGSTRGCYTDFVAKEGVSIPYGAIRWIYLTIDFIVNTQVESFQSPTGQSGGSTGDLLLRLPEWCVVSIPYGAIRWIYERALGPSGELHQCFNPLRGNPVDLRKIGRRGEAPKRVSIPYGAIRWIYWSTRRVIYTGITVSIPYGAIRWIYGRARRRPGEL